MGLVRNTFRSEKIVLNPHIQGAAGTSTNMAANEVIANRALELMGFAKGRYEHCDPHNHVNCSQSTNDAYPTALHIAIFLLSAKLIIGAGRRQLYDGQSTDEVRIM
jgi:aspartate ammonia-lyase